MLKTSNERLYIHQVRRIAYLPVALLPLAVVGFQQKTYGGYALFLYKTQNLLLQC